MKQKIISIFLLMNLSLFLVACGNNNKNEAYIVEVSPSIETPKIEETIEQSPIEEFNELKGKEIEETINEILQEEETLLNNKQKVDYSIYSSIGNNYYGTYYVPSRYIEYDDGLSPEHLSYINEEDTRISIHKNLNVLSEEYVNDMANMMKIQLNEFGTDSVVSILKMQDLGYTIPGYIISGSVTLNEDKYIAEIYLFDNNDNVSYFSIENLLSIYDVTQIRSDIINNYNAPQE